MTNITLEKANKIKSEIDYIEKVEDTLLLLSYYASNEDENEVTICIGENKLRFNISKNLKLNLWKELIKYRNKLKKELESL